MNLFLEIREKFRSGDVLSRLLIINCGVFITSLTLDITFILFSFGADRIAYTAMNYPWNPIMLAIKPWAPATALFASWGLWHLIFNMIILYWLGTVFLRYFTSNNLRGLYIMGGVAGIIAFTGVYLLIPSLQIKEWSDSIPLCSACILAFCTALAFKAPDNTEPIPLIGPVKIKYIVIVLALIDIAILPYANPATDLAHLCAAAIGWLFCRMLRKGKDITAPVTAVVVWLDRIFTPTSKQKKRS